MKYCVPDIKNVKVIENYKLYLVFEDGHHGTVDIAELIPFEGIFEPLADKKFFKDVSINQELGTLSWQNGTDISPAILYQNISSSSQ